MAETRPPRTVTIPDATHFSPLCGLCHRLLNQHEANRIVVIATRTEPLFIRGETWGECCAPLVYGLELFRHARIPKEIR